MDIWPIESEVTCRWWMLLEWKSNVLEEFNLEVKGAFSLLYCRIGIPIDDILCEERCGRQREESRFSWLWFDKNISSWKAVLLDDDAVWLKLKTSLGSSSACIEMLQTDGSNIVLKKPLEALFETLIHEFAFPSSNSINSFFDKIFVFNFTATDCNRVKLLLSAEQSFCTEVAFVYKVNGRWVEN